MSEFLRHVEAKVKTMAVASFTTSLVLAILNATVGHSEVIAGCPPWLQFLIVTFGPTAITAVTGYRTHHTSIPPVNAGNGK